MTPLAADLSFLWRRVAALPRPVFRLRELQRCEPDLWEPLLENGILRPAPIPERFVDERNRCLIVRQVKGRLFGVEDSDEPDGFEELREEDVRQYSFHESAFLAAMREANGLRGGGASRSEGFAFLGSKRIDEATTVRVYCALASTEGPLEKRLRLLARERSAAVRVVVFHELPALGEAVEDALEAANVLLADFSELDFRIDWPLDLGPEPAKPRYALLNEGATWRLIFEGREATVPDSKGIRYLAQLLANPGKSFSALELAHPEAAREGVAQSELEATDPRSLLEYRRRLQRIEEDLEEARAYEREDELYRLEEEKDALLKHLASVAAIGGKTRLQGEKEKARQSVSKALSRAISSFVVGRACIEKNLKLGNNVTYKPLSGVVWSVVIGG